MALKARQKLGKYTIVRQLARGGFATVYEARDTVEGIGVALKVPHAHLATPDMLDGFRREVRLIARLDHPNILPIKTAGPVDGHFVITQPLARETLHERLRRRLTLALTMDFAEQLLAALAHAHTRKIIHCDVKPENLLLFPGNRLRLTDFGISKVAARTIMASGAGTVGFIAPEQAMGKPSARSDVFSAGLVIWRMLSGKLPDWPFTWPPEGHERVRRHHPDLAIWLRKSLEVDTKKRYRDAGQMLAAFRRLKPKVLQGATRRKRGRRKTAPSGRDWKQVRFREVKREHGRELHLRHACERCDGPVSEAMTCCPWCGASRRVHKGDAGFPAACPRCKRGAKLDWRFCAWCHGSAIGPLSDREYSDLRYEGRCSGCRGDLMPFMRYCPWCRRKVERAWKIEGVRHRCGRCGWGLLGDAWDWCPWCGHHDGGGRKRAR